MSNSQNIIAFCKEHVRDLMEHSEQKLLYHNWNHTETVFEATKEIAEFMNLNEFIEELLLAALFHDVGFIEGPKEHEEKSAAYADKILVQQGYESSKITNVKRFILATKMEHVPVDDYECCIRDADLSHLAKEDYMETTFVNLLAEINKYSDKKIDKKDWLKECIRFLSNHQYLTAYAREKFGPNKLTNINKMKAMTGEKDPSKKKKKNKKDKVDNPLKGVETMFKVALRNHVNLSQIADNKANTLISVNAIIISIVLSALFPKLDSNPFLFYPGISVLLFCIVTIILSILSTIPNVNRGKISKAEVEAKKGNLIFFGNYFKMGLEEYEWSMNELMKDREYLYNTLTRDLYFLGKVLEKKYRLLRLAYYAFVIGLCASIIIFVFSISTVLAAQ